MGLSEDVRADNICYGLTVVYESRPTAFDVARDFKETKYAGLARALREDGFKTTVDAIIVGALGAWDHGNKQALKAAGVKKQHR